MSAVAPTSPALEHALDRSIDSTVLSSKDYECVAPEVAVGVGVLSASPHIVSETHV